MRIGFDVSQTGHLKAGCGYVAHSLIERLAAIDERNEYILYPAVGDVFWDPDCAHSTFRCERPNFSRLPPPKSFAASQAFWRTPGPDFEKALGHPEVFHANNFFCPRGLRRARLIYTLHDLCFTSNPEWTTEANRVGCFHGVFQASLNADLVMAVSESSRRHFLEVFPHFPAERVVVVYHASRFSGAAPVSRPGSLHRLPLGAYWLSVATLEPRKNHQRLLRAYARLKQRCPHAYPLVLCGGRGWMMGEFEKELAGLGLSQDVILTGYVDDTALQWLYENCFAFVYPSLFEGFGLPVLEAMSLGAPVIASRTTSIPEIVGSGGVLVDPLDDMAISTAMQQLLSGEMNRECLRAAARREAARFSWDVSARQVMELYERVVNGSAVRVPCEAQPIAVNPNMSIIKRPPPPPSGFDEKAFFENIYWHQKWEVFEGVFTPGRNPIPDLLSYAGVPEDLTGKTVLDIGAWNGGFSLECARRGAARVLGYGPDDPNATGFFKLRDLLGYTNVEYLLGSVYDIGSQGIGTFDIVLFFGVIYHLRYPVLALDELFEVCGEDLFVESFVIDNHFLVGPNHEAHQLHTVDERLVDTPVWEFFQYGELDGDTSNWFGPNLCALKAAVESAGFTVRHTHSWGHRAAIAAKKAQRQFLQMGTYEANEIVARSARLAIR